MTINKEFFINILIITLPFSFIAGNLIINLNALLIILFSLTFYGFKVFEKKLENIDKIIIIFFLYVCVNGIVNDYYNSDVSNTILLKSISYLRYLFLYFVIKFIVINNIINYKYFFLSIGAACLFVTTDLFIQFIFKKDIFGYVVADTQRRLGGPFGDELIAGGFIQRFYIFSIYFALLFLNLRKKISQNNLVFFLISIFFLGAIVAGNRMPLLLFFMTIVLIFFLEQLFRRKFLIFFPIICLLILIPVKFNENFYEHYRGFVSRSVEMNEYLLKRFNYFSNKKIEILPNTYTKEFETGVLTWQQNKYFGGGVKSFYFNCSKIKDSIMDLYGGTTCNQHPHNYYLHIASELGLFGIFFSITIFSFLIIKSISIIFSSSVNEKKILIPFFIVFLAEIFPLRTTGSFFTSTNSTFLFIIISFMIGIIQIKKIKHE
jgi:O-antigen ligase